MAASPGEPANSVIFGVVTGEGGREQAFYLRDCERDRARVVRRHLAWRHGWRGLGVGAFPELGGGDGADRQGGHDQDGVPLDGGVEAGLALVQAEAVLRVGDRLRGFDRLPAEVELANPRHPLAGQRVPVVSAYRRGGGWWLVVVLPDGFPARVPEDDTDLGRAPGLAEATVLSVAGIRRLRELAAAMAQGGRGR